MLVRRDCGMKMSAVAAQCQDWVVAESLHPALSAARLRCRILSEPSVSQPDKVWKRKRRRKNKYQ